MDICRMHLPDVISFQMSCVTDPASQLVFTVCGLDIMKEGREETESEKYK